MSLLVELPEDVYPRQLSAALTGDGKYDFDTAGALAWLSQLAYETGHPDKIETILERWGLRQMALLRRPLGGLLPLVDTRGLVIQGWGGTIVAFGGTDPLVPANWLTDFSTIPSADDVHTGFGEGVKAVWPELRAAVLARDAAGGPLYFTGHSLGGALAVIAARMFAGEGLAEVSAVYTYGMPRCGGRRFVDEYGQLGSRTYRFINGDDIVPSVPPAELGFRHVGSSLSCPHDAKFDKTAQPSRGADAREPSLLGTVLRGVRDVLHRENPFVLPPATQPGWLGRAYRLLPPGIGDHVPSRYLTALGFDLTSA